MAIVPETMLKELVHDVVFRSYRLHVLLPEALYCKRSDQPPLLPRTCTVASTQ
jgi:hypothetical protein